MSNKNQRPKNIFTPTFSKRLVPLALNEKKKNIFFFEDIYKCGIYYVLKYFILENILK
jgi:hypothetical protein